MKRIIVGLWCLIFGLHLAAQAPPLHPSTNNQNAWFMYFGDHKISERWGIHLEAQFRRSDLGLAPQQLLLRTGLNYYLSVPVFATVGYCFVETYPYGEFPVKATFPEHRIWEQLQIKNQIGRFEWINRLRLEQRWLQLPVKRSDSDTYVPGDAIYSDRFRLLNRVSMPIRAKSIGDKSFYLTAYDEMMLSFGKNLQTTFFDQNRAYAAMGYKLPKVGRLEVGYLLQNIYKSDGKIEHNHTLQVGLSSNVDFYKHKNHG